MGKNLNYLKGKKEYKILENGEVFQDIRFIEIFNKEKYTIKINGINEDHPKGQQIYEYFDRGHTHEDFIKLMNELEEKNYWVEVTLFDKKIGMDVTLTGGDGNYENVAWSCGNRTPDLYSFQEVYIGDIEELEEEEETY